MVLIAVACSGSVSPPASGPGASAGLKTAAPTAVTTATPTAAPTPVPTPKPTVQAAADPSLVSVTFQSVATVPGGPLAFAAPSDGSGRLFVAAKDGRTWILQGSDVAGTPLLDLRSLVSGGGEQGLLGLAVHPDFPDDPRVFVDYTDTSGDTVVASYRLAAGNPDQLDPESAVWILAVDQPFPNHNGGAIAFGPDRMLYVALGDGGGGGDPLDSGRRTDTLLGKILRLDIDVAADASAPYAIPPDNPFVDRAGARPEIWLTGLRNPWRMAFDRITGDLWIGDVGQGDWEEVDVAPAGVGGLDFGWNTMEGGHCFAPKQGCQTEGLSRPVTEYSHDLGCTIVGGAVYRGTRQPLLTGLYVFADYCSGRMWAVPAGRDGPLQPVRVGTAGAGIASFGEDANGELYAANLDGTISRVVAAAR